MLWERALFSWRFDDGPLEQLQRCLLCYKNADGGWGHGLEQDLKAPLSHPAALEYLLGVLRYHDIPVGALLDGTVAWLERQQLPDGSLRNPTELGKWPLAPWWTEWGGQKAPDSIVGNLHALGLATPRLLNATRHWAEQHHSVEGIRSNDWLFMTYHAFDYFMNIDDFPQLAEFPRGDSGAHCRAGGDAHPQTALHALLLRARPGLAGGAGLAGGCPLRAVWIRWRRRSARMAAGPTSTICRNGSRSPPSTC